MLHLYQLCTAEKKESVKFYEKGYRLKSHFFFCLGFSGTVITGTLFVKVLHVQHAVHSNDLYFILWREY